MSPDDIITLAQTMVDDAPDQDEMEALLDAAYTIRNDERIWAHLIKLDTSITASPTDTWQTQKALPADFEEPYRLYVGAGDNEYEGVPFEEIFRWLSSPARYSIDYQGNTLRFTGAAGAVTTAYLFYRYGPTSLIGLSETQRASASTIVWPKRFCPMLAFDMAAMHMGGIDADDITRQQVPYLNDAHRRMHNSMIAWNARRMMKMRGSSATQRPSGRGERPDVVSGI